ncbi:LEPR-XLL domain-containing protein [Adhaeretor mobilis]|uniref:Uncharacterized protein n=1 Tax=Adhaeretor mobilis TaxID=1930276 RepID=A0A517MUV5_9BACT|nr:LEPR-XLL domain-containing protein [Adhaeretor mobilis]QDS98652.1 hypothetical protein HG15A2_19330 [Adhaeretor mobilis]
MSPPHHITSRRLVFESLEPREVLSADPLLAHVGDAEFIYYNAATYGTVVADFDRDAATFNPSGEPIGDDTPRYGPTVAHSPLPDWTADGPTVASQGISSVLATGWDADGVTPLVVVNSNAANTIRIYRGYNFESVASLNYSNLGLIRESMAAAQYYPQSAVIHHGLVVIGTERHEERGGEFVPVGTSFLTTQDYGATLDVVADIGGGDIPGIAGGAADGLTRGRVWSFTNPFPAGGLDETNDVWFPWADYLQKQDNPKGGQIGLFRATRADANSPWVVQPNRVLHEIWLPDDSGGLHAHTAAVTGAGVVSHWGDVGYRSQSLLHAVDLDNYLTAPITTTVALGGYDPTATNYIDGPQPTSAAPGPEPGSHLASGDLTREMVIGFDNIAIGETRLEVDAVVDKPLRTTFGTRYKDADILHLQWLQGVGYVSGSAVKPYWHLSLDGENWASVRPPEGVNGRLWLFGERLLALDSNHQMWTAPLPEIEVVTPLRVAPGGTNALAATLEPADAPAAGVTMREVHYTAGAWVYADTGVPLDRQAMPPRPGVTKAYEFNVSSGATDLGQWWLQEVDAVAPEGIWNLDFWVANLADQTVSLGAGLLPAAEVGSNSDFRSQTSAATEEWVAMGVLRDSTPDSGRLAIDLSLFKPSPGVRFLWAPSYLGSQPTPAYPLAPGAIGPNEVASLAVSPLGDEWTAGLVFQWDEAAPLTGNGILPIASLVGDGGTAVTITAQNISTTDTEWVATLYDGSADVAVARLTTNLLRGDIADLLLSFHAGQFTLRARVGSNAPITSEPSVSVSASLTNLDQLNWSDRSGNGVSALLPILAVTDADRAADDADAVRWFHSSLQEKLTLFAEVETVAGDYNLNGVIDAGDYTVWADSLPVYDLAFDGNGDGRVDSGDYLVWRNHYGLTGPNVPGDYNHDNKVDAADYTVWRSAVPPVNPDADGNGDGRIDNEDYLIWRNAYGVPLVTLGDVLASPQSADFNGSGFVTGLDFLHWQIGSGTPTPTATPLDGDANLDRAVDDTDFGIWQTQFGQAAPTIAALVAVEATNPVEAAQSLTAVEVVVAAGPEFSEERSVSALVGAESGRSPFLNDQLVDEIFRRSGKQLRQKLPSVHQEEYGVEHISDRVLSEVRGLYYSFNYDHEDQDVRLDRLSKRTKATNELFNAFAEDEFEVDLRLVRHR